MTKGSIVLLLSIICWVSSITQSVAQRYGYLDVAGNWRGYYTIFDNPEGYSVWACNIYTDFMINGSFVIEVSGNTDEEDESLIRLLLFNLTWSIHNESDYYRFFNNEQVTIIARFDGGRSLGVSVSPGYQMVKAEIDDQFLNEVTSNNMAELLFPSGLTVNVDLEGSADAMQILYDCFGEMSGEESYAFPLSPPN